MGLNKNVGIKFLAGQSTVCQDSFTQTTSGAQQGYLVPSMTWQELVAMLKVADGSAVLYGGLPAQLSSKKKCLGTNSPFTSANVGNVDASMFGIGVTEAKDRIDFWTIYSGCNLLITPQSQAGQASAGMTIGGVQAGSGAWIRLAADAEVLSAGADAKLGFDVDNGKIVVMSGGSGGGGNTSKPWSLNGATGKTGADYNADVTGGAGQFVLDDSVQIPSGIQNLAAANLQIAGLSNVTVTGISGKTVSFNATLADAKKPVTKGTAGTVDLTGTAPASSASVKKFSVKKKSADVQEDVSDSGGASTIIPLYDKFKVVEQVVGERAAVVVADGAGSANFVDVGTADAGTLVLVNCII